MKEVEKTAYFLNKNIFSKGDKVILEALSKFEYIITFLAVQMAGGITVPVERAPKSDVLKYIHDITEAKIYISNSGKEIEGINVISYKKILKQAEELNEKYVYKKQSLDDLSEIIFTTGSTGKPKGTMHTLRGISCNTQNTYHGVNMQKEDIILLPLQLNHSFGLRVLRSGLFAGAEVVLQNGAVFIKETEKNIKKYNCTSLACVASAMELMLNQTDEKGAKDVFGKLHYIEFSAGAVSVSLRKKLLNILPETDIHNTWGSSESGGSLFINLREHKDKIESMGRPLDNIKVEIVDDLGNIISQGTGRNIVGRMALKGDMLMKGYLKNEDLTKEVFKDGYLIMSDLVWRDDDGYLYMMGRTDDIINCGGEKISPNEIEEAACGYENLKECVCIGVKDTEGQLGEIPVLYIIGEEKDFNIDKFKEYLQPKISNFKIPRKFIFVNEFPRNSIGKIVKKVLKKSYEDSQKKPINSVIENILKRRSIRKFTDKDISDELLELLLDAGKYAPSGKNLKTRRFTVLRTKKEIKSLKELVKEAAYKEGTSFNGFENPKILILISNDRRNQDGIQDSSCSAENIMLAASSLGIGSVWLNGLMEICYVTEIREKLDFYKIPKNHIVWATIALGYPDEKGVIPEEKGVIPEEKGNIVHYV